MFFFYGGCIDPGAILSKKRGTVQEITEKRGSTGLMQEITEKGGSTVLMQEITDQAHKKYTIAGNIAIGCVYSLKKKKYCANKRFSVTLNLRYMHGVLNVDEIKN
jgi:hypothetical protein